jgi:small subunit ribosomal protein S20
LESYFVPNLRSSFKRVRVSAKKAARNRPIRTATRTFVVRAETAIAGQGADSAAAVQRALSQLDRAASKGVIHRNNAARRKSRLMRKFNALNAEPEG